MYVAGPIQNPEEARALEQAAYLTDLRARLTAPTPETGAVRRLVKDPFTY